MPSSREVEPTADPGDWGNRSLVVTRHVSQPAPAPASSVPTVPQALDRPLPQGSTLSAPSATARSPFSLVGGDDHPLGPPDLWPESLRTAVDICLASRFPMLVWWGPDLVMLYNDAYHPMLGTKHPRAFGAPGREVWPEIWDVIGPMLDQVMGGGGATWSTDQLLVLDRNGYPEECYFTYSYSPIPDESGGVGGVFCAVTETTERVVGERRLATVAELAHLIRAGQRSDVIETANVVLAGNPHDHPVALVVDRGPGTERADTETALSRFGLELTPGTRARLADLVRQVSGTGRRARVEADAEASAIGVKAWHAYPVPEPGAQQRGRAAAVLLLGESVGRPWDGSLEAYAALCAGHVAGALTGVRELSEERRQHQALLELDEAKSAFFTNISHELRTPLTLMAGPVQDALASEADPVQRRRLELVERGTHRLTRMVDAMLDFGRMEAGHLAPAPAPVDVAELTRALAESFRPAIERAGLGFAHSGDEATVDAVLDRDMYERIVLNLLSNALKYTPSGSVRLTLAVTDRELAVTVADTGVGIASSGPREGLRTLRAAPRHRWRSVERGRRHRARHGPPALRAHGRERGRRERGGSREHLHRPGPPARRGTGRWWRSVGHPSSGRRLPPRDEAVGGGCVRRASTNRPPARVPAATRRGGGQPRPPVLPRRRARRPLRRRAGGRRPRSRRGGAP